MAREQDWRHPDERRRVALAERLARELAHNPLGRHGAGNDFVASVAVQVRLSSAVEAFEAQQAVQDIRTHVMLSPPSFLGQVTGRGGMVMWVHADIYSVVFPFEPFTGLILVCPDDMHDHCMEIYDDGPETRQAIEGFYDAAVLGLRMRRHWQGRNMVALDPEPLRIPGEIADADPSVPGSRT
ncbi:hypothetical protein [Phytohabitans kaempferiae]|uniref:DUF5753 domain-containing protein n=1 Tax=Phytohabitans kaempferiae TaxID=1620943 RepID=A0ABV6M6E0_9ACTN